MTKPLPPIAIGAFDHLGLVRLAGEAAKYGHPVADFLRTKLRRARVVAQAEASAFARPHGWVTCRADDGLPTQSCILAYPEDCGDPELYLSLLSPLGAAVLGLRAGARMPYRDDDGTPRIAVLENLQTPANLLVFRPVRAFAQRHAAPAAMTRNPDDPGPSAA